MSKYFNDERLAYIDELLRVVRRVNRAYLQRKFRISAAQAAHDLTHFQRRFPGKMVYDQTEKTYLPVGQRKRRS